MSSAQNQMRCLPSQQMQPNISSGYNQPVQPYASNSFVGRVVRLRANIYSFVCDYCPAQYRTIDDFLRHTESHFLSNGTSTTTLKPVRTYIHCNELVNGSIQSGIENDFNQHPIPIQESQIVSIASNETASMQENDDEMIEEIYEIIDLGYDYEGIHPAAENVFAIPNNPSKPKQTAKASNQSLVCWFCNKTFTTSASRKRHENSAHEKFLNNIISQKKCYKCKICHCKFRKESVTLQQAQEHLKIHLKSKGKKK